MTYEPMVCALCGKTGGEFHPLANPVHVDCAYRRRVGRCIRCGNWPKICGHDLPFKERIKAVRVDTAWMPNAGSIGGTLKDADVSVD